MAKKRKRKRKSVVALLRDSPINYMSMKRRTMPAVSARPLTSSLTGTIGRSVPTSPKFPLNF